MSTTKKLNGIVFGYEHDWSQPFDISYTFVTVLARSRVLNEQRKSLGLRPIRQIGFTVLTEYDQTTEILNWLRYWNAKMETLVPLPIYSEPIRPDETGSMSALSHIDTNDLSHYKNALDYTTEAIVIDKTFTLPPIIKDVTAVGFNSIDFDSALGAAYQGETTIIYPVMRCIVADHKIAALTNRWAHFDISAQEVLDEDPITGIGGS